MSVTVKEIGFSVSATNKNPRVSVSQSPGKIFVQRSGVQGSPGIGIPPGGLINQVLKKLSATDYDTAWTTISGGGDMLSVNNLSDVANTTTARNNIGAVSVSESIINALIFG